MCLRSPSSNQFAHTAQLCTALAQISWHCQFDSTPTFEKQHKSPSTGFSRFVANFTNGAIDFDGEEPGDEVYFQRGGWGMNDGGNRRVMKWKLETQATIKSGGTRGQSYGPDGFVMDVFARGTSIADYDWENGQDGEEGHWRKQEKEFVDHLCFQIKQVNTGNVIALWGVPGDLDKNGGGADGKQGEIEVKRDRSEAQCKRC